MAGLVCENMAVALLGIAKPHVVLVEDAEIDPDGQGNRRSIGAALVVLQSQVVVAI